MVLSSHHGRLLKRLAFLLIPYSLLRVGFYFYHLNIYKQFTQEEIFESLLLGLRFDLAAICLLNAPIVVLTLLPLRGKGFLAFERGLFIFLNFAGIVASLNDYELFSFLGKRLSWDFFLIADDILAQLPQVFLYYWYLPVTGILFCVGFYFFDRRYFRLKEKRAPWYSHLLVSLLLLGLTFVGIRGGFQNKSINVQSAFVQGKNELGHLVLNTPYHFLRTLKNQSHQRLSYFATDEEAINHILRRRDFRHGLSQRTKKNVVLIILESFASEYVEQGFTPFLSSLAAEGVSFPYHLANGRRSIEALPSLLCGLPALLDEPISKSSFSGNKFVCMPSLLKEAGYTNYFFHGGSRGTMGFEAYTLAHGFDRYFSREDYPREGDYDGTWGIFDGPYFSYVADELNRMPEPFLAGIFSLTSHHPYSVPKEFAGTFPKGTLEIHESIGYADYALRTFFEKVRTAPWFANTIFIITSDHSQKLATRKFQNQVGQFRVPLIIVGDAELNESNADKVTQHSDIPKTVLDLVGVKTDLLPATSVSVFSGDEGMALNFADGQNYLLVTKERVLDYAAGRGQRSYQYDWQTGEIVSTQESNDPLLRAYLQYFVNGLINNNLSIYR
jgi:phosphoglycerol transferase MdoB-like AlkP superfamily enzyme